MANRRVALVAAPDRTRSAFAAYLRAAGFEVAESEVFREANGVVAVVMLGGDDIVDHVRTLIRATKNYPIVVVTSKPSALKELAADHANRLCVLPAPAFAWAVVDALRALPPARPRNT